MADEEWGAQLSEEVWRNILERLSVAELGRAACVCRLWNSIASDTELQINAFKAPWKLKEIIGRPSSRSFWQVTSLSRFAISHKLKRSDTMAGLAIKYQVHVTDIKRLNNMMSDHGIYSRERLLIPVSKPDILVGGTCYIELDINAKREVAVLYLDGAPDGKPGYIANAIPEKGKRRLLESMRRSLQTDDGTAEYYFSISNGDLRTAFAQFSQDLSWEQRHVS
ncbi:hypothetical protein SUGI_0405490 [Cryptomeria japonica]|uniref:F-box protein At1g55000 n=1 Tax=Cryptomeria japonica TaxID=3369 RepID=UPI002408E33B|nr:F-box protein At1g55000 [Cryptomeria japonica]GLJ21742.1 hypothetical protein SUGI_0405490 [Cryptomeria japonica]